MDPRNNIYFVCNLDFDHTTLGYIIYTRIKFSNFN